MAESPVVYLFHGDDENAMRDAVSVVQNKIGDAASVEMNTTRLEGQALTIEALRNVVMASPFLSSHRLVVAKEAGKVFAGEGTRKLFLDLLNQVPSSTKIILLENSALQEKKDRDKNSPAKHWLLKWAISAEGRTYVHAYDLPKGQQMAAWIREKAKEIGGEIQPQAASSLANLVGTDKDAATREIEKLLAHAGYRRPIEAADVKAVSLTSGEQGDFFALIDSLTAGNSAGAMDMLEKLLLEREQIVLFFSLVGHFRLLLQARELVETGRGDVDIAKELGIHPYRAEKLAAQARRFNMETLEAIYQRLLDLDEQIKTGKIETDLALEIFVAGLSAQAV